MPRMERRVGDYEREMIEFVDRALQEPRDLEALADQERWRSFVHRLTGVPFEELHPGQQQFFESAFDYYSRFLERAEVRVEILRPRPGVEQVMGRDIRTGRFESLEVIFQAVRSVARYFRLT